MPLRQYAYFALFSQHVSADEMTSQLGITPDEVSVRGSRFTEPKAIPASHRWKVVCREPGLSVDEQIARLLCRLRPHTARVAELVGQLANGGGGAVLQVVRYFNDTDHDESPSHPDAPDTPNLFGWHLERDVLDFLAAVDAELDVDEYDMTPGEDTI
ncbi:protein of unknown function [Streptomyces sp. TLI_053]|uniref:DUF4279 domain-containing protein n=1 Tax=Streptomyces sp. TLI_053 TaxID=1855352 RepID=UPI00087C3FA0|nr:DUF4279 domain-containing protein [Streptomyces sp. TLI_053]SDT82100.1 protein of unknown function [Streptomyces sp. TLI_053]